VELDAVVGWNAHQVPCLRATGGGVLDLLISVRVDWRWLEGWKLRLLEHFHRQEPGQNQVVNKPIIS
jgi:hypothetical protein